MRVFKLHTLKQKLWAIVAASFVARVIMFYTLPNTPSSLAPDEGTYANVALATFSGTVSQESEYYRFVYQISKSLVIPAQPFLFIGFSGIDAVRIVSTMYGLLGLILVVVVTLKFFLKRESNSHTSRFNETTATALVAIFAFLPSHFIWSTLGLREATNEFWLIMAFMGVFFLYKEGQPKKPLFAVLVSLSIICTFGSRPQVGWVLVVTLLIYSTFKLRNKLTYLLITSVLTGLFAGYLTTTSFAYVTSDLYVAKDSPPTPTEDSPPTPTNRGEVDASKRCDGTKTQVEYEGKIYNCIKSGTVTKRERPSNLAEVAVYQVELLADKQLVNQVGAASKIERLNCPWSESSEAGKYACLAFRAPFMSLTFLFRPFLIFDTTSLSSVFAAAENMLWIFMFMLIVYRISKIKRIPFLAELAPVLVFFSLYVVGAGSYEGNMGTAFRHKSLILGVPLLLLFILFWHKDFRTKSPHGNNSQESAV
jgi:hypothetical protein